MFLNWSMAASFYKNKLLSWLMKKLRKRTFTNLTIFGGKIHLKQLNHIITFEKLVKKKTVTFTGVWLKRFKKYMKCSYGAKTLRNKVMRKHSRTWRGWWDLQRTTHFFPSYFRYYGSHCSKLSTNYRWGYFLDTSFHSLMLSLPEVFMQEFHKKQNLDPDTPFASTKINTFMLHMASRFRLYQDQCINVWVTELTGKSKASEVFYNQISYYETWSFLFSIWQASWMWYWNSKANAHCLVRQ